MIRQLPGEYEVVDMRYFLKKFSCPTTESFDELRGAVMAIIDHINNQQPKKPKSTNTALREKIAVLEQDNNVLREKCEVYLDMLAIARQALGRYSDEEMCKVAKEALAQMNRKRLKSDKTVIQ